MSVLDDLKRRRDARRWQRWTEVDPEDELRRRAGFGAAFAMTFFLAIIVLIVVGLVIAR